MPQRTFRGGGAAVVLAALVSIASGAAPAAAQTKNTGELTGKVSDEQGGSIPGASVQLSRADGYRRSAVANANGEFQVRFLPPGRYTVKIEFDGFVTMEGEVEIGGGRSTPLAVELLLEEREEVVEAVARIDMADPIPVDIDAVKRALPGGERNLLVFARGGPFDTLALGLNAKLRRELHAGFITPGWAYDAGTGTATGPPSTEVRIRLDGLERLEIPSRLEIRAEYGRNELFDAKVPVRQGPAVDTSAVPYMGLPEVVPGGEPVVVTGPPGQDLVFDVGGEPYPAIDPGQATTWWLPPGWLQGAEEGAGGPAIFVPPYGELRTPIRVSGVDPYGETLFVYDWEPVVVPVGLCAGGPSISGGSDLNFAGQQLCVCGCFADAGPLDQLQIGGRPLGPPVGFSTYAANFNTPSDLAPGAYEVGWAPRAGGTGGPFITEVIEIVAKINDEVIQKGGTSGLEMEIVGTDRALPVELVNQNPDKISMKPSDSIQTTTTGGPGRNHVPDVKVKGLERGRYTIDWRVDAGSCPCADTLPEVAEVRDEELDRIASILPMRLLPIPDGDSDSDSDADSDSDSDDEDTLPPGPSCSAPLLLNDDRFRVEIEWSRDPGLEQISCQKPAQDTGLFYFLDPDNWELLVKVLNGCGFNDHYWVFAAATTDVEYTLRVTDVANGQTKSYVNPLGAAAPAITDTSAFATCP